VTKSFKDLELEGVDPLALRARSERAQYNITQEDFARRCGIHVKTLVEFELGVRVRVAQSTRDAVSAVLYEWERNPPEPKPEMRGRWNFARDALKGSRG
jgi:transcriptional regulator with XRE-family HTH domain